MVLPYINMNPPQVYTCSPSWNPSLLPPCTIPLSHPSAPVPSILYPAWNLDGQFVSYMILYMFQCHSPKSSHPLLLPQSPKLSCACVCYKLLQSYLTLCDPMDCIARQAPLSMGFSRQEYWSGVPCPPPGDLPDPEMKPMSYVSCTGRQVLITGVTCKVSCLWLDGVKFRIFFETVY